jgi:hypothetical protein
MDDPANESTQNRPGWHLLDGCTSTRNRKVDDRSAVTVISGLLVTVLVAAVSAMAIYRWRRPGVRCEAPRP